MQYRTKDGAPVMVPKRTHLNQHPEVWPLLAEGIALVDTKRQPLVRMSVDMGRVVGKTICVKTGDSDCIVWASREGRSIKSRFVKDREPEDTNLLSVVLRRVKYGYVLVTAYVGELAPMEVGDRNIKTPQDREASIAYWSEHALILGFQALKEAVHE